MTNLFHTGTSGLLAFQRAIATTSHNIANSNTEGYTRQRVDFASRTPVEQQRGGVGRGVDVYRNERVADRFATARVVELSSEHTAETANRDLLQQLDALVAGDALDITPALSAFFSSIEDANADPAAVPSREVLLGTAGALVERFQSLDAQFENVAEETNGRLKSSVSEINDLASAIAGVNQRIMRGGGINGKQQPNDLLDQREQLLAELAEHVRIRTIEADDGSITVSIGSGVPLVIGRETATLRTVDSEYRPGAIAIEAGMGDNWTAIDAQLEGGHIGGLRRFESESLQAARAELGRAAQILVAEVNTQHTSGFDLDAIAGTDLLTIAAPSVVAATENSGAASVTVAISDTSALRASDYLVTFDGTDFTVRRERDGEEVTTALPATIDGIDFSVTGTAAAGDLFRVSAVAGASASLSVAITDPRKIALSSDGSIGDNANGRAMAALQGKAVIEGSSTLSEGYGTLASFVGGRTRTAEITTDSVGTLLQDARDQKLSTSGVNLDEEAVALTRYEQAYRASAQIISTAEELFNVLLGAVAR